MGNEGSTLAGPPHNCRDEDAIVGGECCGFRILGIQEKSPASQVGFVSFFDFILEANGIRLDTRDATFMELIAKSEDRSMQLKVYNVKAQATRELELTPSRDWPGKGLLGVTIRFDSYEGAEDQLLHVLDVADSSPAERAGLRAESDYLLGTPERVFADPEDLHDEILDALDGSFQCYVFNAFEDQVRIVSIIPTERWGGDGVLGAEVGHGCLHRLPSACRGTIGTSVGFVNLPQHAKAATDAFLKPQRPRDNDAVASGNLLEEKDGNSDIESETRNILSKVAEEQKVPELSENQPGSVVIESTGMTGIEVAQPRYAVRLDHQFPISTVTVLADP